jgi:hypothetical protein
MAPEPRLQFEAVGRAEFDGEAPELPLVREMLDRTKAKLEAVREAVVAMGQACEFEEPTEEDRQTARDSYETAVAKESSW